MARELPTGTVTFVFTDIEGSTRLLQALGDRFVGVLERHAEIIRDAVATHGGVEVSTEGDAFFAAFASAPDAVRAVVDTMRALAVERWPDGHDVQIRVGVHTGEGRLGGDNYVGLDVHRAARIAAAGHGGQVLLSGATRSLIERALPDVALKDLGSHRLKDFEHAEGLWQATIEGLRSEFPPPRTLEPPTSLPVALTSFVGRERELEDAMALVTANRLVTLTGPGGTGKTRLVGRIAESLRRSYADGAFYVDLAPVTDPALVPATIARVLGVAKETDRPVAQLVADHLAAREVLLVIDNFEHLLAAAGIVADLLAAAPRLTVVVTSRRPLDLYGEHELPVPPLRREEAVTLFVDRARAVDPAFDMTDANADAVASIVDRLDNLPLAIELAASRVRLLEPAEILRRLDHRLPLLTSGASDLPARQRTIRGAIAWSDDLLAPAERSFFARLGIFVGGFDLDAVEAVCNPMGELGTDTIDGVFALVQHSLVVRSAIGGGSRFGMLETIREYAIEQLSARGELESMGTRHLRYYRELAELAEPQFTAADQATWLDRFEREHDNVRAALRRAVEQVHLDDGLRLASAAWRFWQQRGYLREGRMLLESLLAAAPGRVDAVQARAYTALGGIAYWLADETATERAYVEAVHIWRALGDRQSEAASLYDLAFVPVMRHDDDEAERRFAASSAAAREVGREDLLAKSDRTLGTILAAKGDIDRALELQEAANAFFSAAGDPVQLAWGLGEMGLVLRRVGRVDEAADRYRQALRLHAEGGSVPGIGGQLNVLAQVESVRGRHREAMRLLGAANHIYDVTGARAPTIFTEGRDTELAARSAIGDAAVDAALEEGRRMSQEEAVAYALGLGER